MKLSEQNVLMLSHAMGIGGTEKIILQMCEILKPIVNRIVVCSCGGAGEKELNELGIKHYLIPDIAQKKVNVAIKTVNTYKRIIEDEKITIIHSNDRMATFYVRLVPFHKFILIVTSHNNYYDKKILTRFAYSKAKIIACGISVEKNLKEIFKIKQEIDIICNSVPTYDGRIVTDNVIKELHDEGYTVIGCVGRLTTQKWVEGFIRSYKYIYQYGKVKYMIIGDGVQRKYLEKLACELKVEDNVIFMGFRNDIYSIIKQLDFLVLCSDYEGLPLVPIEGFSLHKTIVATKIAGTIDIVKDGYNGILVKGHDVKELARGIGRLISDVELRKNLEQNAYLTYEKFYSYDAFRDNIIHFYNKLCEEKDVDGS